MHNSRFTIAVVGVGAVGVAMICRLVEDICVSGMAPVSILAFEKTGQFGTGEAYQLDSQYAILNRIGANMSALAHRPDHFAEWLDRFGYPPDSANHYLPRQVFGHYLQLTLRTAVEQAALAGHEVVLISRSVDRIERTTDGFRLHGGPGIWTAQQVALCTGNLPSGHYQHLRGKKGYFPSPYPLYKLGKVVPRAKSVAVIGSRLSAVDAVVALARSGHSGSIALLSRQGYLPGVQKAQPRADLRYCTPERIRRLRTLLGGHLSYKAAIRLVLKELSVACGCRFSVKQTKPRGGDAVAIFRRDIRLAFEGPQPWQAAFVALNAVIADLWNALSREDQRRFRHHDFSRFMALRVPIPVDNAVQLERLFDDGQLALHAGLASIEHDNDRFYARFEGVPHARAFDVVVNCTGADNNVEQSTDTLYRSLLASRLVSAHPLGGVQVDFNTNEALERSGGRGAGLYVVGNLTCGTHLFCSVMEVNTQHCARVSELMVSKVRARPAELLQFAM